MKISQLIQKLQEEQRKYGDIKVIVHTSLTCNRGPILDVATFASPEGLYAWISNEEAE